MDLNHQLTFLVVSSLLFNSYFTQILLKVN
nr:MAG TPA: hypothetical protein [Caudoviricetes sp.]